jgi:predicted lipoprotein with Yx(FWY)xxD motif
MRLSGSTVGRRLGLGGGVLAAMMAVIVILAFGASAKSSSDDVLQLAKTEHVGKKVEPIAVNNKGMAVYDLVPETTKHLLCTSATCLKFWPMVAVKSSAMTDLTAATGIKGKLGTVRRRGGTLQVTLNGHPLYTFAEDKKKGIANGDGIKNFGGTWHVFQEGNAKASSTTTTTTTTPTTPTPAPAPPPPYSY